MSEGPNLSPRLDEVLEAIADRAFAGRLRKVYLAAANAVERLGDMDLVKYETTSLEGSPDLSLWEEMAPVIRDTVMDVNALLAVVRAQFPAHPPGGLADTLKSALEEVGTSPLGTLNQRRASDAESALHAIGQQLGQQITQLGERMRSPAVVSDRWNLLADLQMFRTRFREMIGDLVYLSASAFGEVHRRHVVPGFEEDLRAAVMVRAAVSDLNRVVNARLAAVEDAQPEDVQWHTQHIERDLDAFGRTQAYKGLRAQDKRTVIEFRQELGKLTVQPSVARGDLIAVLEPFAQFVSSLQRVNNRDVLIAHDREVWAACGVKIEQAEQELPNDPGIAHAIFLEAVHEAQSLYGRDPSLDAFLRKAKKGQLDELEGDAFSAELDRFRELIASLPMV